MYAATIYVKKKGFISLLIRAEILKSSLKILKREEEGEKMERVSRSGQVNTSVGIYIIE